MTNKKTLRRVVVLVLSLLLCSMSFLCVTLAKYSSTENKTISTTAKEWSFEVSAASEENGTITLGNIAPGDSGSVVLKIENTGEVKASYTVVCTIEEGNGPEGLTFTSPT